MPRCAIARFLSALYRHPRGHAGFRDPRTVARLAYDAGFAPLAFVSWRALFGLLVTSSSSRSGRRGAPVVNPFGLPRERRGRRSLSVAVAGLGAQRRDVLRVRPDDDRARPPRFYTYPALVAASPSRSATSGSTDAARRPRPGPRRDGPRRGGRPEPVGRRRHPVGVLLGLLAAGCQTSSYGQPRPFTTVPPEQAMAGSCS